MSGSYPPGPNERNLLLAHHGKPVENPAPVSIAASGMAIPHPEKVWGHLLPCFARLCLWAGCVLACVSMTGVVLACVSAAVVVLAHVSDAGVVLVSAACVALSFAACVVLTCASAAGVELACASAAGLMLPCISLAASACL